MPRASWPRLAGVGAQHPQQCRCHPVPASAGGGGARLDRRRELAADRTDTQFVGLPATVAAKLAALSDVTGADELLVTTITHDHANRVRSYALLAQEWARVTAC
jgi:alkanesulfonate monooxygenase SsuD/methylene tetrahydromethanopterin reductase-like flavin-dependent oxidoreductase (luciferase family)